MCKKLSSVSLVNISVPDEIVNFCNIHCIDLHDFVVAMIYPGLDFHLKHNFVGLTKFIRSDDLFSMSILNAYKKGV